MKQILSFILMVYSLNVFAINQCPDVEPRIHINLLDEEPIIKSEFSSKDLTKEANPIYSDIHVLGRYSPKIGTQVDIISTYRNYNNS